MTKVIFATIWLIYAIGLVIGHFSNREILAFYILISPFQIVAGWYFGVWLGKLYVRKYEQD